MYLLYSFIYCFFNTFFSFHSTGQSGTKTDDGHKKFSSSLIDLLKTLSSINLMFNTNAQVKGRLNIHIDSHEAMNLDIDESVQLTGNNYIEFVSNSICIVCDPLFEDSRNSILTDENLASKEACISKSENEQQSVSVDKQTVSDSKGIISTSKEFPISASENEKHLACINKKTVLVDDKILNHEKSSSPLLENEKKSTCVEVNRTRSNHANLMCKFCDKLFYTKLNLTQHEETHHVSRTKLFHDKKPAISTNKSRSNSKEKLCFECCDCGRRFSCFSKTKQHLLIHSGNKDFECTECGKKFAQYASLYNHKLTHTGAKPYVCEICQKRFSSNWKLKDHRNIHTGAQPYQCTEDRCGNRFSSKDGLLRHKLKHRTDRPFACDRCEKCFVDKSALTRHSYTHNRTNNGDRPFICEDCGKTFANLGYLTTHRKIHSKLFVCDICSKEFSKSHSLKIHKWRHAGVKTIFCTDCGKAFVSKPDLKPHKLTHTKNKTLVCPQAECGKSFARHIELKRHLYTHSKEKQFKCDVCDKKFSRDDALRTHQLIHSKEKPFICGYCGKSFAQKGNMKRHIDIGRCRSKMYNVLKKDIVDKNCEYVELPPGPANQQFQVFELTTNENGVDQITILKVDPSVKLN